MLIVLGGLPGVGKTTAARALSRRIGAVWLRVDTIEQALRDVGVAVGVHGYAVAQALALENLAAGQTVLADCVNPVAESRDAWAAVAAQARVRFIDIEMICSDPAEHRRRVEARAADIQGHRVPTWSDVLAHDYQPSDRPRTVVDTAGRNADDLLRDLLILLK